VWRPLKYVVAGNLKNLGIMLFYYPGILDSGRNDICVDLTMMCVFYFCVG